MHNHHKKGNRWVEFGRWVQRERLLIISKTTGKPITQGEAGRRAGLSRVHWSRMEAGDTGIKETTVPLVARALGRTTEDEIKEVYKKAGFAVEEDSFELPPSMKHFIELPVELQKQIAALVENHYRLLPKKEKGAK